MVGVTLSSGADSSVCRGDCGRAGAAWLGIPGEAFACAARENFAGLELRRPGANRGPGGGGSKRRGTHNLLFHRGGQGGIKGCRSEEHTSELQSPYDIVCRLLLETKKTASYREAACPTMPR